MTVGTELKQARQNAGLSPEQISERTKIQLYKIDALENDNYELLPQGIYLDGIVRAYAREVEIDPERMVERARLERGKLPGDSEIPFAAPIQLHGPSTPPKTSTLDDPLDSFATENDVAAVPILPRSTQPPLAPLAPPLVLHAPNAPHASNAPHAYVPRVPARPVRGRFRLALPVFAMIAAAGWGAYLFESKRPLEGDVAADTQPPAPPASPNDIATTDAPANPRDNAPGDVPPPFTANNLSGAEPPAPSDAKASAVPQERGAVADSTAPPAQSVASATPLNSAPSSRPIEPQVRAAEPAQPESIGTSGSAARSVQNVSGSWRLATQVESSSYSPFAGLQLGYEVKLEQDGDRVTGVGRKVTENGSGIGPRAQTPLTVSGTIAGDRLTLTFIERGTERPTQGKFVLLVDEGGTLRGRFSSDAAQSSGRVEAHRVSPQ
jgi:transcriptional regulator with XRE-family HTH domain